MMAQSGKREARMEGVFKRMKVLAFCAKFHEFLSICAQALKDCSVVKDKRNDCLRSPILSHLYLSFMEAFLHLQPRAVELLRLRELMVQSF